MIRHLKRLAAVGLLTALMAVTGGWANVNPAGDIQAYAPGGGGNQNNITGPFTASGLGTFGGGLQVTGNANATTMNLIGPSELKFSSNVILESDGASVYASPSNDTTGSLYWYTGGAQRGVVNSTGAWTLNGNVTVTGSLTATGIANNGNSTLVGNSNVTGQLRAGSFIGPNYDLTGLGPYDTQAQSRLYMVEDFLGPMVPYATFAGGGYGHSMSGGSDPNHPGGYQFYVGNGTTTGAIRLVNMAGAGLPGFNKTSPQNITFGYTFKTPGFLSNANDRWVLAVGPMSADSTAVVAPMTIGGGAGIRYSNDINSGKWQCVTQALGSSENTADSGITVAASTWYNLRIEVAGAVFKFYLGNTLVCTITDSNVNAASNVNFNFWSGYMERTVSPGVTNAPVTILDRAAIYITNTNR